ncbi:uncharacterized protein TEOVI_000447200 [Trypanosoma equiperdum]|uniref:Uncharacterized protein n=1 Tax=Trypanosoma equiperdum TaxID=5694 RepID=A0A1G4IK48_TRYEQ|nr:hypothetical protein, conserved [Trypanosoma equiperdum]
MKHMLPISNLNKGVYDQGSKDPYNMTETLWLEMEKYETRRGSGTTALSRTNTAFSPLPTKPIPLFVIHQWRNYVSFCRWTIAQRIDWREVFSYLCNPKTESTMETNALHNSGDEGMNEVLYSRDGLFSLRGDCSSRGSKSSFSGYLDPVNLSFEKLKHELVMDCTSRFGTLPICVHQQRLLRWTKMLIQCVVWRLRYAFNVVTGGKGGVAVSDAELQSYRVVLTRGREVFGAGPYLRELCKLLDAHGGTLTDSLDLPTINKSPRAPPVNDDPVLNMTLTMVFDQTTACPGVSTYFIPSLAARSLDALWVDKLHIPWDILDPKDMPEKVRTRLLGPMTTNETAYIDFCPVKNRVQGQLHSTTFHLMFDAEDVREGVSEGEDTCRPRIVMAISSQRVELHQLISVVRLLEAGGYVMLTKIRHSTHLECYRVLPFLGDYITLRNIVNNAIPCTLGSVAVGGPAAAGAFPHSSNVLKMADLLLFGLSNATRNLYEHSIVCCLQKYRKRATDGRMTICMQPLSPGAETGVVSTTVSKPCISVLETVVEPTLGTLQLMLSNGSLKSSGGEDFGHFVLDMLVTAVNSAIARVSRQIKSNSGTGGQLRSDHALLRRYINMHPASTQLQESNIS